MKLWNRQDEWIQYANCGGDYRFTSESSSDDSELEKVCHACRVRPECIQWALEPRRMSPIVPAKGEQGWTYTPSSVFAAGVRLPDPSQLDELEDVRDLLRDSLPGELLARGDDV